MSRRSSVATLINPWRTWLIAQRFHLAKDCQDGWLQIAPPFGTRTPRWICPLDVAKRADVALGSSVPLIDGDVLVGALTLYCNAGNEIAVEQRLLIQSIAPLLASAVSASTAHDEVAAIDATKKSEKEALYSVIDTLLSSRSQWPDRSHPDRLTIVLVSWQGSSLEPEKQRAMQAILQRAISSATNGTGHLLRLSASEMLITAPLSVLVCRWVGTDFTQVASSYRSSSDRNREFIAASRSVGAGESYGIAVAAREAAGSLTYCNLRGPGRNRIRAC